MKAKTTTTSYQNKSTQTRTNPQRTTQAAVYKQSHGKSASTKHWTREERSSSISPQHTDTETNELISKATDCPSTPPVPTLRNFCPQTGLGNEGAGGAAGRGVDRGG